MRFLVCMLLLSNWLHVYCQATNRSCQKDDLEFAYTKCKSNTRWRVQVPKVEAGCQATSVAPPTIPKACNFTCGPGQRLDISSDSCQPCPVGTYSVGSGFRWDTWKEIPDGFKTELQSIDEESESQCSSKSAGWHGTGDYLGGRTTSNCIAKLSRVFMATSESKLTFRVSNSDELTYFTVSVKRCDCSEDKSPEIKLINANPQAAVQTETMKLQAGMNKVEWTLEKAEASKGTVSDYRVRILSIEIDGLSSSTGCQPCRPGHSSTVGSSSCKPCPPDQFSPDGRACAPCPSGQFAPEGASGCKPRPKCSSNDYQASFSNCSIKGEHNRQYSWILPKICDDTASDSAKLPPAEPTTACGTICNPGQQALPSPRSGCEFCPKGTYSADGGQSDCQKCPKNSQPVASFVATRWLTLPPLMNVSCLPARTELASGGSGGCRSSGSNEISGWLLEGDYLQTARTRMPELRLLSVKFAGFAPIDSDTSVFSFDFEMQCSLNCELMLVRMFESRQELIKTWTGSQKRHAFRYFIHSTDQHNFALYFNPASGKDASQPDSGLSNYLRIFSLNATNVIGAGAVACKLCPMGEDENGCAECKGGEFYNTVTSTCQTCPNGTISATKPNSEHCRLCPPGLRPAEGAASCEMDTMHRREDGKVFNLTELLTRNWQAAGGRLFSWKGTKYQHLFNVSFSGSAICRENGSMSTMSNTIKSSVCRSTLLPSSAKGEKAKTLLPMLIGSRLANVTPTASSNSRAAELLAAAGWPAESDGYELQAFFESDSVTKSCPTGRTALLTLRCSAAHTQPELQLPPKCPDGTCDGCVFHFMLLAQLACPLCRLADYDRVKGECVLGKQIVHLYPPKHCYLSGSAQPEKKTLTESCPIVSQPVAVLILMVTVAAVVCLLLACHCYRTNRRLQYQYTQLIEAKEGCELPGVESCAVDDGDEEEDEDEENRVGQERKLRSLPMGDGRVRFESAPRTAVLSRLKKTLMPSGSSNSRSRRKGDSVEHLNLNDGMDDLGI